MKKNADLWSSAVITLGSELHETLRARWYHFYILVFGLLLGIFMAFGLHESSIMGFTGLGRSLLAFIQLTIIVVPLFVILSTARTFVADYESGVWEYLLSWPFHLRGYFLGRSFGRLVALVMPLILVLLVSGASMTLMGRSVPWGTIFLYVLFTVAMVVFFLGLGLLLSVCVKTQEQAIGMGMGVWLIFEAVVDALFLGLLVKQHLPAEVAIGAALLNPLQAFRTASIALFDPQLTVLGPISYTLLEIFGLTGLSLWAVIWPMLSGLVVISIASEVFVRKDIAAG